MTISGCSSGGSSPLARGLRTRTGSLGGAVGIIPARAGFTGRLLAWRASGRDHPRSRGVYHVRPEGARLVEGSSPLARGLRLVVPREGRVGGIIPARAGFTGSGRRRATSPGDHPRSRGVYPQRRRRRQCPDRIIPARAGFTVEHRRQGAGRQDHPRSRGVYSTGSPTPPSPPGSSPLARGLLEKIVAQAQKQGIIPARAGFTGPRAAPRRRGRDHPRSRGVY